MNVPPIVLSWESSLVRSSPKLARGETQDESGFRSGLLGDEQAIASFTLSLAARGRSPATLSTYTEALQNLRQFAWERGMPPLLGLSTEHIRAFLAELYARGNKPGSVRNRWASISSFYGWANEEGELPRGNPMERVKPPSVPDQLLPHYTEADMSKLLAAIPERSTDELVLRNRAIILLLFDTGLRAAELCSLVPGALDLRARTLSVRGKGGKERVVGIGATTATAIDRYQRKRRRASRWLFASLDGEQLKTSGLRALLVRQFASAGVPFHGAHAFRRAFGIAFLAAGGEPNDLKTLAGWSSYEMLRRYTKATERERGVAAHHRFSPADSLPRR